MAETQDEVTLGLLVAPGLPPGVATVLSEDLATELTRRFPAVGWRVQRRDDPLVRPPADDAEIVAAARERLLAHEWDLAIALTDLPLQVSRRPVIAHASPVHEVGVLSIPALGAVGVRHRALQGAIQLVEALLGEPGHGPGDPADGGRAKRLRGRVRQLSGRTADVAGGADELRFTARVLTGNLRLLVGMVRANRPWRLVARLSRALTAAIAAGVFALVTPDIWRLSAAAGSVRLAAVALASVVATAVTLVVGASLWERAPSRRARKQVALFNLATVATVVIGVIALYAALLVLATAAAGVLVLPRLLGEALGHSVGFGDYLTLAWLTSSLATVGGALGAGLETDETVRQAAYSYRSATPPAEASQGR